MNENISEYKYQTQKNETQYKKDLNLERYIYRTIITCKAYNSAEHGIAYNVDVSHEVRQTVRETVEPDLLKSLQMIDQSIAKLEDLEIIKGKFYKSKAYGRGTWTGYTITKEGRKWEKKLKL